MPSLQRNCPPDCLSSLGQGREADVVCSSPPLLVFPVYPCRHVYRCYCPSCLTGRLLSDTVPLEELCMGRRVRQATLDNRLRQRRQAAGLSQQALATRCGLTRQAVNAIEAGRYVPHTLVALGLGRAPGGG